MNKYHYHYHPDPDHTPDGYDADANLEGSVEDHPLWQRDNVTLTSVCIDIGSAEPRFYSHECICNAKR